MKILSERLGNIDIFTKILLMKSLILSKPLHCFRVYAPDEKMLTEMWKVFKSALWTKSFNEKLVRRTKVAANRLCIPVKDGGLGIIHIKTSAALSLLSSFLSMLENSVKDPSSILASILHENLEQYNTAIRFLNSHYFKKFWAKKIRIFFPQASHLIDHLQELFDFLETDNVLAFLCLF